jgi:hypothetical protein
MIKKLVQFFSPSPEQTDLKEEKIPETPPMVGISIRYHWVRIILCLPT